jgi:hypothetical protein
MPFSLARKEISILLSKSVDRLSVKSSPPPTHTAFEGLLLSHVAAVFKHSPAIRVMRLDWFKVYSTTLPIFWPKTWATANDVKRQGGWTEGIVGSKEAVDYIKSLPFGDNQLLQRILQSRVMYCGAGQSTH